MIYGKRNAPFQIIFTRLPFKWEYANFFFIYERKIADMAYYINAFVKQNNNVKHINNGSKKSIYSPFF